MPARSYSVGSITALSTVLFVTSLATLIQSFIVVKIVFLELFVAAAIADVSAGRDIRVYPRLLWFYAAMTVGGIVWAIVGWLHPGNSLVGIVDALRLYCLWSVVFTVLFTLLRSRRSLMPLHWAMVTSNNIGALFLIVPYLLSLQFRQDAGRANSALTKLSLVLCLIVVAVAGRRALWLVVALAPCMILLLSSVTRGLSLLPRRRRHWAVSYSVAAALVVGLVVSGSASVLPDSLQELGYTRYLRRAFSDEDERTIQRAYLIDGFAQAPLLGSGCSLFIGAYSNPYLRSFDLLFFVGLLPYLSTFRRGFERYS